MREGDKGVSGPSSMWERCGGGGHCCHGCGMGVGCIYCWHGWQVLVGYCWMEGGGWLLLLFVGEIGGLWVGSVGGHVHCWWVVMCCGCCLWVLVVGHVCCWWGMVMGTCPHLCCLIVCLHSPLVGDGGGCLCSPLFISPCCALPLVVGAWPCLCHLIEWLCPPLVGMVVGACPHLCPSLCAHPCLCHLVVWHHCCILV